jgi:predicted regulator of Ras-like GTPase activity (Roadblock/LC7/MglB family)
MQMSFQDELKGIGSQVPGCRAAVIMNLDGLVVARHDEVEDGLDIEILLVELTNSLKQAMQAASTVEGGELSEFVLAFEKGSLVVRALQDEHFVALLMEPGGMVGRGRYELRRRSQPLIQELF